MIEKLIECFVFIEDDELLERYNGIWNKELRKSLIVNQSKNYGNQNRLLR